ncbi:hypothetical protein Pelo_10086 [Pelomyxa schiedti]|nr:hypothetical protein Pelo_10086 [Pelomyxa schiedti]
MMDGDAGESFKWICDRAHWIWKLTAECVEWLLNHIAMQNAEVERSWVMRSVKDMYNKQSPTIPLLLLERFAIDEPKLSELLIGILKHSLPVVTLSQAKKLVSMGRGISREAVAKCFAESKGGLSSSKTTK